MCACACVCACACACVCMSHLLCRTAGLDPCTPPDKWGSFLLPGLSCASSAGSHRPVGGVSAEGEWGHKRLTGVN